MSQMYSTRQRELVHGQLFSTLTERLAALPPVGRPAAAEGVPAAAGEPPAALPEQRFTFALTGEGIAPAPPYGAGASGWVTVAGRPGGACSVTGTLTGLMPPRDRALQPTLWLIHDLTVPADLSPADRVLLPRGAGLAGNRPGDVFTLDGNPPTYGQNANTLAVAVSPGVFTQAGGTWQLNGAIDAATNQAYHPLVLLGPIALADINTPLPSGTVARIITDLFMRPATVHPELNVRTQHQQRLAAIVRDSAAAPGATPGATPYLDPARFTRAAVTLEGIVRGIPRLMPTRDTCFLVAPARSGVSP